MHDTSHELGAMERKIRSYEAECEDLGRQLNLWVGCAQVTNQYPDDEWVIIDRSPREVARVAEPVAQLETQESIEQPIATEATKSAQLEPQESIEQSTATEAGESASQLETQEPGEKTASETEAAEPDDQPETEAASYVANPAELSETEATEPESQLETPQEEELVIIDPHAIAVCRVGICLLTFPGSTASIRNPSTGKRKQVQGPRTSYI